MSRGGQVRLDALAKLVGTRYIFGMKTQSPLTRRRPEPLVKYFVDRCPVPLAGSPPKSMRVLWTMMGAEPARGVQHREVRQVRWQMLLDVWPAFNTWVRSDAGLRAPSSWSPRIEHELRETGVYLTPLAFCLACFPGRLEIAASYSKWRGMPELCAAAHGWPISEADETEALHAVRALSEHVPFVVYVLSPDFTGIALPSTSKGLRQRLVERNRFLLDPMGRARWEWKQAIDPETWPASALKALPRTPWIPRARACPVERRLVEAGVQGWRWEVL